MRSTRRTGVLALAASLVLTAGAVTVVVPATADTTPQDPPPTEWVSAGDLGLSAANGQVTFDGATQTLISTNCNLTTSGVALLELTGTLAQATLPGQGTTRVGYKSGLIGVNEKVAELCNLVDPATTEGGGIESLDLGLGDVLKNFAERPLKASGATLQLRMGVRTFPYTWNKKSTVKAEAYLGTTKVGQDTLIQGSAECPFQSYGQSCTWTLDGITGRFDTLRLTAEAGAFGLAASTFALKSEVDKTIDCEATDGANTYTDPSGATVLFAGNVSSACTDFGVTLGDDPDEAGTKVFRKNLSTNTDAQLIFTIPWDTVKTTDPTVLPPATIDFEIGTEPRTMPFCPDYLFDSSGKLRGLFATDDGFEEKLAALKLEDREVDVNSVPGSIGTQFACIGDRQAEATKAAGSGFELKIVDQIYLIGDAKMRLA